MKSETATVIDVIILSYASNAALRKVTQNCIRSLLISADPKTINFNIIVIESQKGLAAYRFPSTTTIYPQKPFGYHRYMNIGINMTKAPYVCMCNNDLIFHRGWANEMLRYFTADVHRLSASPVSSILHPHIGIPLNSGVKVGYRIGVELTGWCIFVRRQIFQRIGMLDENYTFSGADHDYANTLAMLGIEHALITSSIVDHFDNTTLALQPSEQQNKLMKGYYHYRKWLHRILPDDQEN